ncbi:hypothetical protein niasHT_021288 [Heterodera trifolii]|uniref:Uncharacterized protein n=1 Tax=Heterodera trifolii TaxID=157864 RepID=A0ABD2JJK0_9BILA
MYEKAPKELREFRLSIVAASDSVGVTIAGFSAILLHNHICNLQANSRPETLEQQNKISQAEMSRTNF